MMLAMRKSYDVFTAAMAVSEARRPGGLPWRLAGEGAAGPTFAAAQCLDIGGRHGHKQRPKLPGGRGREAAGSPYLRGWQRVRGTPREPDYRDFSRRRQAVG